LAVTALFPDGTTDITVTNEAGHETHPVLVNNTVAFSSLEKTTR